MTIRRLSRLFSIGLFVLATVVALAMSGHLGSAMGAPPSPSPPPSIAGSKSVEQAPRGPLQQVHVGAFVLAVRDLNLRTERFVADYYLWFRWTGDSDPSETFEVMNAVETTKELCGSSESGGVKWKVFHCKSTIHQAFDLRRYPLDRHILTIEVEDTAADEGQQVYVADVESSTLEPKGHPTGWDYGAPSIEVISHRYATNYGDPSLSAARAPPYSRFVFTMPIHHPGASLYLKSFMIVFISLAMACLCGVFPPQRVDTRLMLALTATFALVCSEFTLSAALPANGALTVADKMHMAALALIFTICLEAGITNRIAERGDNDRAERLSRWFGHLSRALVAGVVACLSLWG